MNYLRTLKRNALRWELISQTFRILPSCRCKCIFQANKFTSRHCQTCWYHSSDSTEHSAKNQTDKVFTFRWSLLFPPWLLRCALAKSGDRFLHLILRCCTVQLNWFVWHWQIYDELLVVRIWDIVSSLNFFNFNFETFNQLGFSFASIFIIKTEFVIIGW